MSKMFLAEIIGVFTFVLSLGIAQSVQANPKVLMKTSMGDITIELYPDKAPITVKNFLHYVNSGHYSDTIFHRVIGGFMLQGGGFTNDMTKKGGANPPIKNEATNGLKNSKGTLAMARTGVVDSATDQFFINVADNGFLDHRSKSSREYGYAVFGKVTKGMDVVEKIEKVRTTSSGPHQNVPATPVIIQSATEIK